MKIAVVGLTGKGVRLGEKIALSLLGIGHETVIFSPPELIIPEGKDKYLPINTTLKDTFNVLFREFEGIVCVMALGIVVRLISPLINSKLTDPAVVVVDELGRNVISALSGHWGGANELTGQIAGFLGANPVITTATDVNGLPAIDVIARENGLMPEPFDLVKKFNSDIVNGRTVHIFTEIPLEISPFEKVIVHEINELKELTNIKNFKGRLIAVTNSILKNDGIEILYLRPENVYAGIGCRKGVSAQEITEAIANACKDAGISPLSLNSIASIELKKNEAGLLEAARELNLPVKFFKTEEIGQILADMSDILSFSKNVQDRIGVGGVCEPAALLSVGENARLILPKTIYGRVTVALAGASWPLSA